MSGARKTQAPRTGASLNQIGEGVYLVGGASDGFSGRKTVESELQKQVNFTRTLLDAIPNPVFFKDAEGRYLGCNRAFELFIGIREERLIGKSVFDISPPELAAVYHQKDLELINSPGIQIYESDVRYADGSRHEVIFNKSTFLDENGRVAGIAGVISDISQRKQIENELTESEARYRQAFEINTAVKLIIDSSTGQIIEANPAACRYYGYDKARLQSLNIADINCQPEDEIHAEMALAATQKRQYFNFTHRLASGEIRDVEVYSGPVVLSGRRLLYSIIHDVTDRKRAERALLGRERILQTMLDSSRELIALLDVSGTRLMVNKTVLDTLGVSEDAILGKPFWDSHWWAHEDVQKVRLQEAIRDAAEGNSRSFEAVFPLGERRRIIVDFSINPVMGDEGEVIYLLAEAKDITEQKRIEEERHLSAQVFEHSNEAIVITNADGSILSVNSAFSDITGYDEADVLGKTPGMLSSGRHDRDFYRDMWSRISLDGYWQGEIWNRRKDGSIYPEWLSINRVLGPDGETSHYIGTFSDITHRKETEQRIQYLAHYDVLTGLPNRVLLMNRFNQVASLSRRNNSSFALMFLDIDNFKNINDSLGHRTGDALLVEMAKRLEAQMRKQDTVARAGGDEFVLLLPDVDERGVANVAEKLIMVVSEPCVVEGNELVVTPSIGIAMYPNDGTDFEVLSKYADTAMYRAKQDGRNNYRFYQSEMNQVASRRLRLESALRRAIEREELSLVYQPQVSTETNEVIGVEALLRWTHPEFGPVSPAEFIPLAEDCGLITGIGEWVLRAAVRQMKEWLDAGCSLRTVAVNLSAIQFRHDGLMAVVGNILEENGLSPTCLELELTESAAMQDAEAAITIMNQLRSCGISVSIDDFGTGYSSLNYLNRLPISKLKIDQSFVRQIGKTRDGEALVRTIISLGYSLNFSLLAEGVENDVELKFLRDNGCSIIQGYYFSKPLLPGQVLPWIDAFRSQQSL